MWQDHQPAHPQNNEQRGAQYELQSGLTTVDDRMRRCVPSRTRSELLLGERSGGSLLLERFLKSSFIQKRLHEGAVFE